MIYVYPTFAGKGTKETKLRLEAALIEYLKLRKGGKNVKFIVHGDVMRDSGAKEILKKSLPNLDEIITMKSSTNSIDEINNLKEIVKDNYTVIYTSDYHVPKWRLLMDKYKVEGEVRSVDIDYSILKKSILYILHTVHGYLAIISPSLYKLVKGLYNFNPK